MIIPDVDQRSSFSKEMMGGLSGIDMDRLSHRLSKNIIGSVKANPRGGSITRPRGVIDLVQEAEALLMAIESDPVSEKKKKKSSKFIPVTVANKAESQRLAPQDPARFSVVFDQIIVREYPRIVGATVPPSGGPGITMDWKYTEHPSLSVDDFESIRAGRRYGKDLLIGKTRREKIAANLDSLDKVAGKILLSPKALKPSIKNRLKSILTTQR